MVVARAREGGCGLACFAGLREAQLPGCHAKSAGFQTQKPWQQPVAWESGHQSRKCSISVTISQNAETHGEEERKLAKVESLASVETRRRMPPSLLPCFPPAYFSLTPPAVLHLASVSCPPMGKEEGQSCLPSRNNGRSPSAARAVDVRAFTRPQSLPARFSAFIFFLSSSQSQPHQNQHPRAVIAKHRLSGLTVSRSPVSGAAHLVPSLALAKLTHACSDVVAYMNVSKRRPHPGPPFDRRSRASQPPGARRRSRFTPVPNRTRPLVHCDAIPVRALAPTY